MHIRLLDRIATGTRKLAFSSPETAAVPIQRGDRIFKKDGMVVFFERQAVPEPVDQALQRLGRANNIVLSTF